MYKIEKNKNTGMFEIIELKTEGIIFKSKNYDECRILYGKLKNGKGFCGWTPKFFLQT